MRHIARIFLLPALILGLGVLLLALVGCDRRVCVDNRHGGPRPCCPAPCPPPPPRVRIDIDPIIIRPAPAPQPCPGPCPHKEPHR